MQFGGLVSTSNTFTHDFVTIETDKPLIFTMDRILHHVDDDYSATNGFFVRENSDTIGEQDSEL